MTIGEYNRDKHVKGEQIKTLKYSHSSEQYTVELTKINVIFVLG